MKTTIIKVLTALIFLDVAPVRSCRNNDDLEDIQPAAVEQAEVDDVQQSGSAAGGQDIEVH